MEAGPDEQCVMDTIGSAGTLVVAGLATAGQYLQAKVLDLFWMPFGSSFALLIFLIAAVSLFYRVAIFGDYRSGLMLLFGATLFGTAVFPTVTSYGVKWQFGDRQHDDRIVADTLKGVYDFVGDRTAVNEQRKSYQVSWLFAKFDELTSGIVQSGIKLIGVTSGKEDLKFLVKTSNYQQLLNLGVIDSQVQLYLHSVLFERCAEWIGLHQAVIDPAQASRAAEINLKIDQWVGKPVITNKDASWELTNKLYTAGFFGAPNGELAEKLSCDDLWLMGVTALKAQAYSQSVEEVTDRLPEGLTPDEMLLQAAIKFGGDDLSDREDIARMINAIAARMIMGAFREQYPALSRVNVLPPVRIQNEDDIVLEEDRYGFSKNLQTKTIADADFSQGEYFGYLAALPYVQGILIFFLTLSYPVFALMLLNPMRVRAYLIWFGLWFWVKLWDFGFSIIMRIDQLLYYLIPHGPNLDDAQMKDPGEMFRAVLAADPTSSILIYWDIMAMLLGSIPILTAMMTWVGGNIVMYQVQTAFTSFAQEKMGDQFQKATGRVEQKVKAEKARIEEAKKNAQAAQQAKSSSSNVKSNQQNIDIDPQDEITDLTVNPPTTGQPSLASSAMSRSTNGALIS